MGPYEADVNYAIWEVDLRGQAILLPQTLNMTRVLLRILASPCMAFTSAGVAQSAFRTCAFQSSRARIASAYLRLFSQNVRKVRLAMILTRAPQSKFPVWEQATQVGCDTADDMPRATEVGPQAGQAWKPAPHLPDRAGEWPPQCTCPLVLHRRRYFFISVAITDIL